MIRNFNAPIILALSVCFATHPDQGNARCCYYDGAIQCADVDAEACQALGGAFDEMECAGNTCESFCEDAPRVVRHGSAQIHDGVEYLIPSGQTECRFLDGAPFVAIFEFDEPVAGEDVESETFSTSDFEISGAFDLPGDEDIELSPDGLILRLTLYGDTYDSFVCIRFTARSRNAHAIDEDVRKTFSFCWPILLADVDGDGTSGAIDTAAISSRIDQPIDDCSAFRFDIDRDGEIGQDDESFVLEESAEASNCRVDAVSRKFHGGGAGPSVTCFDIPAGRVEPRYESDGASGLLLRLVFTFWMYDQDTSSFVNFWPLAEDCGVLQAEHFCISDGAIDSVSVDICDCRPGCGAMELTVLVGGVADEEYFTIAFDAIGPGGVTLSVEKQWIQYVGAVGYPDPVGDLCDYGAHLNFVDETEFGDEEAVDETNFYLDLDLDGIVNWFGPNPGDAGVFIAYLCEHEDPTPNNCCTPQAATACCTQSGKCAELEPWECAKLGGLLLVGESCATDPCTPTDVHGACCYDDGGQTECTVNTFIDCSGLSGTWREGEICTSPCAILSMTPTTGALGTAVAITISTAVTPLIFDSTTTAQWDGVFRPIGGLTSDPMTITYSPSQFRESSSSEAVVIVGDGSGIPPPPPGGVPPGSFVGMFSVSIGDATLKRSFTFHVATSAVQWFRIHYPQDESGILDVPPVRGTAPLEWIPLYEPPTVGIEPEFLSRAFFYHVACVVQLDENAVTLAIAPTTLLVDIVTFDATGGELDRVSDVILTLNPDDNDPNNLTYESDLTKPIVFVEGAIDPLVFTDMNVIECVEGDAPIAVEAEQ